MAVLKRHRPRIYITLFLRNSFVFCVSVCISQVIKITSESISEVIDFYTAVLTQQIGGDQSVLSLKNQALRLLMVFLTGVESEKVEEAVQHMYVNDFPVCASELTKESIQSSYYLQAVDLIVHAVALCGNRAVFEICVKLVCRDENHPLIERFQKMFETICVNEHGEEVQNILETPWKIFTNAQYAIKHREIAAEKILLAMLRSAAVTALIAFSSNHLSEIVEILETKQRVVTKELLVSQKCCFQVCEVLCTVLPKSELVAPNSHLTLAFWNHRKKTNSSQDKPKGSELIQFLCRTADSVAHENAPPEIGLEDVQRKLHCAAYRLSVAGITATQIDLKFYFMCFFEEKPEKGRILWTNFIDVEKTYEFPVEFAAVPRKKRQLAAIHREIGEKSGSMTQSSFSAGEWVEKLSYLAHLWLPSDKLTIPCEAAFQTPCNTSFQGMVPYRDQCCESLWERFLIFFRRQRCCRIQNGKRVVFQCERFFRRNGEFIGPLRYSFDALSRSPRKPQNLLRIINAP